MAGEEELGLASDDAGARVFAAGVTGLFQAMLEHADPDGPDVLADERGVQFLRGGLEALRQRATR